MTFTEFQSTREKILRERRGLIDCAETNLYAALAALMPPPAAAPERTVHRCHLATEWTERFDLPPAWSARALISCGVRHSLELLFRTYATSGAHLWLPEDNYPVYRELALAAGMAPRTFPTLPQPCWPEDAPADSDEILLVTNPLKPLGSWLSTEDVSALKTWLGSSPRRRLLLDAVYTFGTSFHPTSQELVATGQVILLHSLTKGWLHPRLFGIALVPEIDSARHTPVFRSEAPPQHNLARARELMGVHAAMPGRVARDLMAARERLEAQLSTVWKGDAEGYFTLVHEPWQELLEAKRILGVPASVFGSCRDDLTILSSLGFVPRQNT